MPSFTVTVVSTIVVNGQIEVSAKDKDAAREKVDAMILKGKANLSWSPSKSADENFEWEEESTETAIEECESS